MSLIKNSYLLFLLGLWIYSSLSAPLPGEKQIAAPDAEIIREVEEPPYPYVFGYQSEDGLGNTQHRHEESDGTGIIKGSYGYKDSGGIYRTVNYTADGDGYRVMILSNEPGVENQPDGHAVIVVAPSPSSSRAMSKNHIK